MPAVRVEAGVLSVTLRFGPLGFVWAIGHIPTLTRDA